LYLLQKVLLALCSSFEMFWLTCEVIFAKFIICDISKQLLGSSINDVTALGGVVKDCVTTECRLSAKNLTMGGPNNIDVIYIRTRLYYISKRLMLLNKYFKLILKLCLIWHHNKNRFIPYLQSVKYDNEKCLYQEIHRLRYFSFSPWRGWYLCDQIDIVELRWSCSLLVTCPETRQNMPRSVFFSFYIET